MRREYIESMQTSGFSEFITACEELKNCKYIVAEKKIASLLKAIADNKQLYSMFGAALYRFDYNEVFDDCVENNTFSLPTDRKAAIALVFRILLDIDGGKMSLAKFLEAYFYTESINESYARFALEVISPFESYCRALFAKAEAVENDASDDIMIKEYSEASEKYRKSLRLEALKCINVLLSIADGTITGVIDRAEYGACLNGLIRSINADDAESMISAFIGVKYAVSYFYKSSQNVMEIYKKLECDIKRLVNNM